MLDKQENLVGKSFMLDKQIVKGIKNAQEHFKNTQYIKLSEGEILRMFLPQSPLKEFMPAEDEAITS